MRSYLSAFLVALVLGVLLTPAAARLGVRLGAIDRTRDAPIPRAGGLAVVTAAVLSLLLLGMVFTPVRALVQYSRTELSAVYLGALGILALGVIDDIKGLSAPPKFAVEIAIAVGLYLVGVRASTVWLPFGIVSLGWALGLAFTVLWIVGITNAFNLLDGIDGAAAGAAVFALLAMFVTSVTLGQPLVALLTVALAGATLGFLPYNFPPAKVYLGDAGSLFLGFM
ncbi:MAG: MraY family glycosyltransferase, partial [Gemmatimonadales bacterium]|nr:MraY family glycosyltransferase [Gemmatimonadales bacterium]